MKVYLYSRARHASPTARLLWGDYWVRVKLEQAFLELGHTTARNPYRSDLNVFCWGKPPVRGGVPRGRRNVAWFYSHPDQMTAAELRRYSMVFCTSSLWLQQEASGLIHDAGVPVRYLPVCSHLFGHADPVLIRPTDDRLYAGKNFVDGSRYLDATVPDVVFIGNARSGRGGRPVVRHLLEQDHLPFTLGLWGKGWQRACEYWMAEYRPFDRLQDLYHSAKVVLIDHHPDMAQCGFLKHQIPDVIAAGGLPVVDDVRCAMDAGAETPWPVYRTPDEALEVLSRLTKMRDGERERIRKKVYNSVPHLSFIEIAEMILASVRELL